MGGSIDYFFASEKTNPQNRPDITDITRTKHYTASFLLRRYHSLSDKLGLFGEFKLGLGFGKARQVLDDQYEMYVANLVSLQAVGGLGATYKINDTFGLELLYGSIGMTSVHQAYQQIIRENSQSSYSIDGSDLITEVGFNFDKSTFRLGINYSF